MSKKVLGRGLEALISSSAAAQAVDGKQAVAEAPVGNAGVVEIELQDIGANPFQPRKRFDDDSLKELADSIKASGILQPVIVRKLGVDNYQLVAGERRLRAAHLAGLTKIPAIVREYTDTEMMELALIENIQREDLNPIDEARAYHALIERVGLTHDQVSERVGKQRSSISNALRLLVLPVEVMEMVSRGTLTAGHARAILSIESSGEQLAAARYVQSKGFSVRRTEAFVRRKSRKAHSRPRTEKLEGLGEWETKLQQKFGTHVAITPGRKGGKVEFEFYSQEDLERLLEAWAVM
ncbi:MAG: ParB/RepB/Spo0J family partition protein [Candidatus Eisenbacteria bacterium]|uniref:ParB/RepB/Spo0J family partition protein n=1 Tax=Eiseniibacteriota bacterium TaxID=2212470 RepID=A0A933SGU7_UNCEI|nr:ParB/RepB/Spo0J family partition protein [Candidatus Eisenbacteria bacterium]